MESFQPRRRPSVLRGAAAAVTVINAALDRAIQGGDIDRGTPVREAAEHMHATLSAREQDIFVLSPAVTKARVVVPVRQ